MGRIIIKGKIKMLYNHDDWGSLPFCKSLTMAENIIGRLTRTKMSKTQADLDIRPTASESALDELSIGCYALQAKYADYAANSAAGN